MMKVPDDQNMPEEIDFTGGVRGKYAERYREGVSIHERFTGDAAALSEIQARLGGALRQAQMFEALFVTYLALVQEVAVREAGMRAHQVLEHGRHASQSHEALWDQFTDKRLQERFDRFINERNWIIHRWSFDLDAASDRPEAMRRLADRLFEFVNEASILTQHLRDQIQQTLSQRGLSAADIEAETRQVIAKWANVG